MTASDWVCGLAAGMLIGALAWYLDVAGRTTIQGGGMTDRYPKVGYFQHDDGDCQEWAWCEVGDLRSTHQVVPLGGIHLYRDENGQWPEWTNEAALTQNEEGDDETRQDPIVVRAWVPWVLDALEAAQEEPQ